MEYLHKDKETFLQAINLVATKKGIVPEIVEKDYYVTMILRGLAKRMDYIVFKGGTSLSKCHQVIKRFSEDIDITIDKTLSQGQKKSVKGNIVEIVEEMGLEIPNLEAIRSRRDYNKYIITFHSVIDSKNETTVPSQVLMETSYTTISFPTVIMPVYNYIGDMMVEEAPTYIDTFGLNPFDMKIQSIERTFIDKLFALCDYYMQGKTTKHSRHLYDIYKLFPKLETQNLKKLYEDVRNVRKLSHICPSAVDGVDVKALLQEIISKEVYKLDYQMITEKLLEEDISYERAIITLERIIKSDWLFN
ncbi:MAG: nucleotidyl transferase AbiEii/AbiGii toxin family protein [Sphaerochaetaceae bacterium]|nr:nucleotidyl transferase AbiEii/AbiGii toxin family protein [Sphaerochaetaceae bacterium]